jgi:hypothetical protein
VDLAAAGNAGGKISSAYNVGHGWPIHRIALTAAVVSQRNGATVSQQDSNVFVRRGYAPRAGQRLCVVVSDGSAACEMERTVPRQHGQVLLAAGKELNTCEEP